MLIQKLIGPTETECGEWGMFFRKVDEAGNDITDYPYESGEDEATGEVSLKQAGSDAGRICGFPQRISAGETLSLETYFNAFSIGKWKQYTTLNNLSLVLEIQGQADIRAYHALGSVDRESIKAAWNDEMLYTCIASQRREISCRVEEIRGENTRRWLQISFPELPEDGIVYVTLKPADGEKTGEPLTLFSGYYETGVPQEQVNPVELVLGICTFQREEFLKKNVNLVLEKIINNPDSPLYGHVEVYISDNGQSVPPDTFDSSAVHLFSNKNAGGAGGFTRTMIESLFYRKNSPFTHIILMDDDIVLSTEVLERTYHFLQMLSPKHKDMMVGGEMFMLNKRYKQFEAGATWRGTEVQFYNKMWDMRRQDCVAANELPNPINYSGWWYSVIPTSIITKDNLPIPLFIHYDDMEYGVRNEKNGTILLNGICVWHPQGFNKAPTRMTYYDVRNMMIGMADSDNRASAGEVIVHITNRVIGGVIRYRYEDAEVCYEAIRDFYRGPEFFMEMDPLEKHADLVKFNYTYEDPSVYDIDLSKTKDHTYRTGEKFVFLWGLLLWLLPSTHKLKVAGVSDIGLPFGAKKVFHYDKYKKQGYMTEKSYARAWKDFTEYCRLMHRIRKDHEAMMDRWAKAKKEFTGLAYWEKYLELDSGDGEKK